MVLIAGDDSIPAFDNAVRALNRDLLADGVPAADIRMLTARGPRGTTAEQVTDAITSLNPGPGEACLVFMTSHGIHDGGLIVRREQVYLPPDALADMLDQGCGRHPTVLITSGCFAGLYADDPRIATPNRVVLTAARSDRTSFGCSAGETYTFYDACLLSALHSGEPWSSVARTTDACVAAKERDLEVESPSLPQQRLGSVVGSMVAP